MSVRQQAIYAIICGPLMVVFAAALISLIHQDTSGFFYGIQVGAIASPLVSIGLCFIFGFRNALNRLDK